MRMHTSMNDLELILEKLESSHHTPSDARKDFFWYTITLKLVYRARIHVFHAVVDASAAERDVISESTGNEQTLTYDSMKNAP